jgi:hypothetical protein
MIGLCDLCVLGGEKFDAKKDFFNFPNETECTPSEKSIPNPFRQSLVNILNRYEVRMFPFTQGYMPIPPRSPKLGIGLPE